MHDYRCLESGKRYRNFDPISDHYPVCFTRCTSKNQFKRHDHKEIQYRCFTQFNEERFCMDSTAEMTTLHVGHVKRICVFEHSVMTNFNCACPAIQRGQRSAFCLKVPLDSLLAWASSEGSGETWLTARIGDKYQIRLTRSMYHTHTQITISATGVKYLSRLTTKPTIWHVRPAKTQISLGTQSESSMDAQSLCWFWHEAAYLLIVWTNMPL